MKFIELNYNFCPTYSFLSNEIFSLAEHYQTKKKVKIAIVGAGIGGCSAAYFLEEIFKAELEKVLEIDIFEQENEIEGHSHIVTYDYNDYDVSPHSYVNISEFYIKKLSEMSGCTLSNLEKDNYTTAYFDFNGITTKKLEFKTFWKLLQYFGWRKIYRILKFFLEYLQYKIGFYQLQDTGYSFDNIENILRKINPNIFTWSQHSFNSLLEKESIDKNKFARLSNLATLNNYGQNNKVPGIVGIQSIMNSSYSYFSKGDLKKISNYLLSRCHSVRLYLNSHVKSISDNYHNKKSNLKNTISFVNKNGKEVKKSYDYVIISFPLTKNIAKQKFALDILYRDFLNCEMNSLNSYLIDGTLSLFSFKYSNMHVNFHTDDSRFNFQSIRSYTPVGSKIGKKIYSVVSSQELNESTFDKIFTNYNIIKKTSIDYSPLYKKVQYSHTPFPQIIIDGKNRSRIFYLNSIEWLESSKEMKIIAARNIALLIGKKELKKSSFKSAVEVSKKYSHFSFTFQNYDKFLPYAIFSGFVSLLIAYVKLNQHYKFT